MSNGKMNKAIGKTASAILICLLALPFFGGTASAGGDSKDTDFDYDIFLTDDTLAVWLDITPVLTQSKMEDLLAGLDISMVIEIKIERPRKLLFSKILTSTRAAVLISHPLTEDIYRLRLVNFGDINREFKSQLELSDFLSDSLILKIAPKSLLENAVEASLRLAITSKSHSSNVLEGDPGRPGTGADEEFFESLFSFFLNLIGFGQTSYRIVSPPFSLSELASF